MRESFGGVFMIRLLLVFIVIYVSFTAVSLNYARAFKIKNNIIDYLETNDVISLDKIDYNALDKILNNAKYNKVCNKGNITEKDNRGVASHVCYNGIEIYLKDSASNRYITYEVLTYADWNLGALNMILALGGKNQDSESQVEGTWKISGNANIVKRRKGE